MARMVVSVFLLAPLLSACVMAGGAVEQPVSAVLQGAHCGEEQTQARWITADQLPSRADASSARADQPLLQLSMGERPTSGYGLELAEPVVTISGAVATIQVAWREPPAGSMTAQVITRPCLVLSVPVSGYERLEVVDDQGAVRLEVLPPS